MLYIAARSLPLYVNSHYQGKKEEEEEEDAVFSLRGKRWEVKQRRGGMEGDEYPFLGLILLSGVAISVF